VYFSITHGPVLVYFKIIRSQTLNLYSLVFSRMKLVKTYDMWGQNESLDELVNLEGKKSQKNTFKIWPIFIILNLDITNLNRSRGYTKDPNSGKKSIAKANFFFEKNLQIPWTV
jgi:hypothetical protein